MPSPAPPSPITVRIACFCESVKVDDWELLTITRVLHGFRAKLSGWGHAIEVTFLLVLDRHVPIEPTTVRLVFCDPKGKTFNALALRDFEFEENVPRMEYHREKVLIPIPPREDGMYSARLIVGQACLTAIPFLVLPSVEPPPQPQ